jgi:hypothetical protein
MFGHASGWLGGPDNAPSLIVLNSSRRVSKIEYNFLYKFEKYKRVGLS